MKEQLKELINLALAALARKLKYDFPKDLEYQLETPKHKAHGDVALNVAFRLAKEVRKPPMALAEMMRDELTGVINSASRWSALVSEVSAEKPGFINFRLAAGAGAEVLFKIHRKGAHYGEAEEARGLKILIEFVSANPTGPLTIAHGRQAVVGDTLARILTWAGNKVHREYYINDGGRQIRLLGESLLARYAETCGKQYPFPEDGYRGEYIKDLAGAFQKKFGNRVPLDESGRKQASRFAQDAMIQLIEADLKRLDLTFDRYFSEQSLYDEHMIEQTLEQLKRRDMIYEQEGALWFKSSTLGDEKDRVLRKSSGEMTYLAPDIAYHRNKFERGYERLIDLMGPDHHGYVPRLKAACAALGFNPDHVRVLIVQLVSLYRGGEPMRMSTRAGAFITLKELMDEVGADATRIFFIQRKVESHLDFDVELAKKRSDENPLYYLQYVHARISSILSFAGRKISESADLTLLEMPEERALVQLVMDFPAAIEDAAALLEPFRLLDYLKNLAAAFHKFYARHRVVTENEKLTDARLLLVSAVRIVMRNGLSVLGVTAPEKM